MIKNPILVILFVVVAFMDSYSQDTLNFKEVYLENDLVFRYSDETKFTGIAQKTRKNGQLVCEQHYKDGVVLYEDTYYLGKGKKILFKTYYNKNKPWVEEKEYYFGKNRDWVRITTFDENGNRTLVQRFEEGELVYSCEYAGRKKHGTEYCFDDEGNKISLEYYFGKKKKE